MNDKLGPVLFIVGGILLTLAVVSGKISGKSSGTGASASNAPGPSSASSAPAGALASGASGSGASASPISQAVAAVQGGYGLPSFKPTLTSLGTGLDTLSTASGNTTLSGVPLVGNREPSSFGTQFLHGLAQPGAGYAQADQSGVPGVTSPWALQVQEGVAQAAAGLPGNTYTVPDSFALPTPDLGIAAVPVDTSAFAPDYSNIPAISGG